MSVSRPAIPAVTIQVVAIASLSLGAISRNPSLAVTGVAIGLALFAWSLRADRSRPDPNVYRWAGVAVIFILLLQPFVSPPVPAGADDGIRPIWLALLLLASAVGVVWGQRQLFRRISVAVGLLAVVAATLFMTVGEWRSDLGYDVYWMHRSAGEAVFAGENPWTDAVQVENGSPTAPEGAVIEGYSYTPVVLATYAVSGAEADPRLVSSIVWIALLGWLAWLAVGSGHRSDSAYAIFLLLAGLAAWPLVWFASWTEPLSVGLLALAVILWRRRPVWSAVTLGLAIASKQYFIFLAPLLLLHKDRSRWMRLSVSLGVAAVTILVGLIPDPSAFVTATITNLSEIGFRPESQSLTGLLAKQGIEFHLPPVAWILISLAFAAVVAIGSRSAADFAGRAGLTFGLAFIIGQAFPNYWFFVLALLAVATVQGVLEADPVREERESSTRSGVSNPSG